MFPAGILENEIQIVPGFEVFRDEADGLNNDLLYMGGRNTCEFRLQRWPLPLNGTQPALVCDGMGMGQGDFLGEERHCFSHLLHIGIAPLNCFDGKTVGCEEDVGGFSWVDSG